HRDLKPENILLTPPTPTSSRRIKIADFGMASTSFAGRMLLTSCGSPHYASPEIIRGVAYDGAKADIWSLGVILFALLTGNLPFDDENIKRLLQKVGGFGWGGKAGLLAGLEAVVVGRMATETYRAALPVSVKSGVYAVPDWVPRAAADLIKRILVVDPNRRLTMEGIIQHPWFRSRSPPSYLVHHMDPTVELVDLHSAIPLPNIDHEVVEMLVLLGLGDEQGVKVDRERRRETLVRRLGTYGDHPYDPYEKVFYHLLLKRKRDALENYDVGKDAVYEREGGPRRRRDSLSPGSPLLEAHIAASQRASVFIDSARTSVVFDSSGDLSARPRSYLDPQNSERVTTRLAAMAAQNQNQTHGAAGAGTTGARSGAQAPAPQQWVERVKKDESQVTLINKSGADSGVADSGMADVSAMQFRAGAAAEHGLPPVSPGATGVPGREQGKQSPPVIHVPSTIRDEPASTLPESELMSGNGKVEELDADLVQGMEFEMQNGRAQRAHIDGMEGVVNGGQAMATPSRPGGVGAGAVETPNRSWFANPNLFQWKADSYELVAEFSGVWSEDISGIVKDTLAQARVKSQNRSSGMGYKCKWDGMPASQRASHLPGYGSTDGRAPMVQDLQFVKFK
ncbi:hypothetical protein HDU93_007939, partial [Gonapodya sp. JEL0774]